MAPTLSFRQYHPRTATSGNRARPNNVGMTLHPRGSFPKNGDANRYDELPEGRVQVELVDAAQELVGHRREVPLVPEDPLRKTQAIQPGPHPQRDGGDADE